MSHNSNDVQRSARRHRPAIIAIIVALAAAGLAMVFFSPVETNDEAVAPAGAVVEGTAGTDPAPVSPEGAAPTPSNP